MNKQRAVGILDHILTTDRILHEQQLGLKWSAPVHTLLKITDLPSYQSALNVIGDTSKTGIELFKKNILVTYFLAV